MNGSVTGLPSRIPAGVPKALVTSPYSTLYVLSLNGGNHATANGILFRLARQDCAPWPKPGRILCGLPVLGMPCAYRPEVCCAPATSSRSGPCP